jgi:uncharacterized protein YbaP (TraB family)
MDFMPRRRTVILASVLFISLFLLTTVVWGGTEEKPFLWRIESKTTRLYLLGSIHVANESIYPLKEVIERAFEESECVAVEADIGKAKAADLKGMVSSRGMYKGEETLERHISGDLYQRVDAEARRLGLPLASLRKMKPWYAAVTIAHTRLTKLGYRHDLGIDLYFLKKARNKKNILELESVDYQMRILADFSPDLQVLFLEDAADDIDAVKEETGRLFSSWMRGDVPGMARAVFGRAEKRPGLSPIFKKLLDERNEKMVEKIEGYMKEGSRCFVIVGAAHLVGERGMLNLLSNRGYRVEQM